MLNITIKKSAIVMLAASSIFLTGCGSSNTKQTTTLSNLSLTQLAAKCDSSRTGLFEWNTDSCSLYQDKIERLVSSDWDGSKRYTIYYWSQLKDVIENIPKVDSLYKAYCPSKVGLWLDQRILDSHSINIGVGLHLTKYHNLKIHTIKGCSETLRGVWLGTMGSHVRMKGRGLIGVDLRN